LYILGQSWAKLQRRSPALTTYEDRTLYSTWQVSFEQIEQRNSLSVRLLRLWAYFDNQGLWFELLDHSTDHEPEWVRALTENKLDFQACVKVLCDHGLVEANAKHEYETESTGYSVHACVHTWMSAVLNAEFDDNLARVAAERVASHVPAQNSLAWSLMERRLLNHAVRCSTYLSNMNDEPDLYWSYHVFGDLYCNQGKLAEAEAMYQRAL
jgi:tetratricopeptide (TPR) repeat protein